MDKKSHHGDKEKKDKDKKEKKDKDKKEKKDKDKKDKEKKEKDKDKKDKDKKEKKDKEKKEKKEKKDKERKETEAETEKESGTGTELNQKDTANYNDGKVRSINLADYEMGETLGTGSFGRVKIAKNKKTGEYVAMKMMKKIEILKSKQADHIANEIKILSMVQHPFVITFGGFTQDDRNLYLDLELINGGELFTYLRGVGQFPLEQAKFYICQIICIFDYLHNKDIIYRDLKPENILIHKSGYLKLTDFGFAKIVEGRTYTLCGTPEYLAPEIILNKGHGKPVDWWTTGILLYEMIAGIDPFSDDDPMMVYQKILKGKIKFPSGFDSNAKSIIKHLLDADLTKRYGNLKNGVKDITGHRFFKNFEWDKLLKKELTPPYVPNVKSQDDISNFSQYPDSDNPAPQIKKEEDPFLEWFQ
jgi:serine/threonine protein kinase